MKHTIALIAALLFAPIAYGQSTTAANKVLNPDSTDKVVSWFKKLIVDFDAIATKEEKLQFIRMLEKLHVSLQKLQTKKEAFTRLLLSYSLSPEDQQIKGKLRRAYEELRDSYQVVLTRISDISPKIREELRAEGNELQNLISDSMSERSKGITLMEHELKNSNIDHEKLKKTAEKGIAALVKAEEALAKQIKEMKEKTKVSVI